MSSKPLPPRANPENLRAGVAAPPDLLADIGLDWDASPLPLQEAELREFAAHVDIVLVVAERGLEKPIGTLLFGLDLSYRHALFDACKAAGIPVVLWRLDDSVPTSDCATFARACSAVFAARPELADIAAETKLLPVGVQVARYHPYMNLKTYIAPVGRTDVNHGAGDAGADNRASFLRRSLVTTIRRSELGPADLDRQCLESAACGCLPIVVGDTILGAEIKNISIPVPNETAVVRMVNELRANPLETRRRAHTAWRTAFRDHTLKLRLATIARAVRLEAGWDEYPLVTVFVPTYRVEFLGRCLENYRKQSYPERELILALHTDSPLTDEAVQILADNKDVRIVTMPREETVGSLMNLAIHNANGSYCIKMDDDDFYGENYVLDMILAQRAIRMDIFGKPPAFTYFEASDQTCLRRPAGSKENCVVEATALVSNDFRITGSTHSGRTEFLRSVMFCERSRGAADTSLFERCERVEVIGATLDAFNTAAFRAADQSKHTWRQVDAQLLEGAHHIGTGYRAEAVEI